LDPQTGKIYHVDFNKPPQDDAELLQRLIVRSDDTEGRCLRRAIIFGLSIRLPDDTHQFKIILTTPRYYAGFCGAAI